MMLVFGGLYFWRFSLGFLLNFRLRILGRESFRGMTCTTVAVLMDLGLWNSQKVSCAIRHLIPNDKMENGQYQVSTCLKTGT